MGDLLRCRGHWSVLGGAGFAAATLSSTGRLHVLIIPRAGASIGGITNAGSHTQKNMADESSRHGGDQQLGQVTPVIEVFDDFLKDKGDGRQRCMNAAANPAAAPGRSAGRRPCLATPSQPAMFEARAPAI